MLAWLAERQFGAVARWQLLRLGLTDGEIEWRVRTRRLHVIHRGVYAVGHPTLSADGHAMAAVLACGEGALLSHRSAAARRALLYDNRSFYEVTAGRGHRSRKRIRVHTARGLHDEDRGQVDGVPVTSVARTLLDVAESEPRRLLERALKQADKQGVFDLDAVHRTAHRNRGHRGAKPLLSLVAEHHSYVPWTRSDFEDALPALCDEHDIRRPAMNLWIAGHEVDAAWLEERVLAELDSWIHHRSRRSFEDDRRRDADLAVAGFTVVRITDLWMQQDPAGVAGMLRELLYARRYSPYSAEQSNMAPTT